MSTSRLKTILLVMVTFLSFSWVNAQQTRELKIDFSIGRDCYGYIITNAKFTGFAGRMNLYDTKLYIQEGSEKLKTALKNSGVPYTYYNEIGTKAYKISRFDLYMKGYVQKGQYVYDYVYSKEPFKLQLSNSLGDYATPDFDYKNKTKDYYKGANSWENSGAIVFNNNRYPFEVTEIYFRDIEIRIEK